MVSGFYGYRLGPPRADLNPPLCDFPRSPGLFKIIQRFRETGQASVRMLPVPRGALAPGYARSRLLRRRRVLMAVSVKQAALAVRRAEVVALRIERVPFAEIAERLEISDSTARLDYKRALERARAERNDDVPLATVAELASLEAQEAAVWQVLRNRHVMVHNGQVVTRHAGYERDPLTGKIERDADGVPLEKLEEIEDDAPVLAAVDRLGKIGERQSSRRGRSSDAVESALRRQLDGMTEEIREGPLAQVALRLAAEVDAGLSARDAAALTRELRLTIARLEELSPAQGNGDIVDELAARRAERLAAAAEG